MNKNLIKTVEQLNEAQVPQKIMACESQQGIQYNGHSTKAVGSKRVCHERSWKLGELCTYNVHIM